MKDTTKMKCPICKDSKHPNAVCYHDHHEQLNYLRVRELNEIKNASDLCNVMVSMLASLEAGAHPGNNHSHCHWCGGERSIYSKQTNHRRYCFLESVIKNAKKMNITPYELHNQFYEED